MRTLRRSPVTLNLLAHLGQGGPVAHAARHWRALLAWFDTGSSPSRVEGDAERDGVDWARIVPFVAMHVACLGVIWVGISPVAVGVAAALYILRMFAITGFYHRYFSHRSFKTSRAAHPRHHHVRSDRQDDVHSPVQSGFLWSHMGWFLARRHFAPDLGRVRD